MARRHERERFDGYAVELFLDEDGDWMAHLAELPGISAFGPFSREGAQRTRYCLGSGQGILRRSRC